MTYVYVLVNEKKEFYFGSTNDLKKRLAEHNSGKSQSTRNHLWKLVYYEAYFSEKDARERERQIKAHGMAKAHLKRRLKNSLSEISAG